MVTLVPPAAGPYSGHTLYTGVAANSTSTSAIAETARITSTTRSVIAVDRLTLVITLNMTYFTKRTTLNHLLFWHGTSVWRHSSAVCSYFTQIWLYNDRYLERPWTMISARIDFPSSNISETVSDRFTGYAAEFSSSLFINFIYQLLNRMDRNDLRRKIAKILNIYCLRHSRNQQRHHLKSAFPKLTLSTFRNRVRWTEGLLSHVSSIGVRVGKLPTHSLNPPGSGSCCRRGLSAKSRPVDFYPRLDMPVMMTWYSPRYTPIRAEVTHSI